MKLILYILTFTFFVGCSSSDKNTSDIIVPEFSDSIIVSDTIVKEQIKFAEYIPSGNWKLNKIISPWGQDPIFPEREVWNIHKDGKINILKDDTITQFVDAIYERALSGLSSDSVWVIKGSFDNSMIQYGLEIWRNNDKMTLIDQCDDCYTFEFEELKK